MQRVMIIGCGGAGKSTMAKKLAEITGLPLYHLDKMFWKSGWEMLPTPEWKEMQTELCEKQKWIIDGNYGSTIDLRMKYADTILYIDFPRWKCIWGIVKRRFQYRNRTRPDMTEGCNERLDWTFMKWVWNYREKKRPEMLALLKEKESEKQVIYLKNRNEIDEFLLGICNE